MPRRVTVDGIIEVQRREGTSGQRMCGSSRIIGGLYWEWGTESLPASFEQCLIMPPIEIDVEALGLSPIGVKVIVRNGVTHLLDWVGEIHYPYLEDFIVEAARMGVSRRLHRNLPFANFSRESRLLLVHRKAILVDGEYRAGIFASVPLGRVAVVRDAHGAGHTAGLAALQGTDVPYELLER